MITRMWVRCVSILMTALVISAPAFACGVYNPYFDFNYVKYADTIVIGRINNYKVLPRVARFDIKVEEIVGGTAPKNLTVIWYNSTFKHPESMPSKPMLIALRKADLRVGPGADIYTDIPEIQHDGLEVLQQPCTAAFILPPSSQNIAQIRLAWHLQSIAKRLANFNWAFAMVAFTAFSAVIVAYFRLRRRRSLESS